jgi:hypothetical protein
MKTWNGKVIKKEQKHKGKGRHDSKEKKDE